MTQFHINPSTGDPTACKALVQCPFGGPTEHYPSRDEARFAYEKAHPAFDGPMTTLQLQEFEDKAPSWSGSRMVNDGPLADLSLPEAEALATDEEKEEARNLESQAQGHYWSARMARLDHLTALRVVAEWMPYYHAQWAAHIEEPIPNFDLNSEYRAMLQRSRTA